MRVATASRGDYERELEHSASDADTRTPYHARKRALMAIYVQLHKHGLLGWLKPARSMRYIIKYFIRKLLRTRAGI